MAAWWPAEGDAVDIVNTNTGVLLGGLGFTNGEVGQGFWFTATNQGVEIPPSPSLSLGWAGEAHHGALYFYACTFECWINPTDVSQPHAIFDWNGLALSIESNGVLAASFLSFSPYTHNQYGVNPLETSVFLSGPGLVVSNAFQHVAVIFIQQHSADSGLSGTVYLYYNGVQLGDVSGYEFCAWVGPSGDPHVGYSPTRGIDFAGILDEASFYSANLTGDQIAAIYNAGSAGKCPLPPFNLTLPVSQPAAVGGNVVFNVVAHGTGLLAYQWLFNGSPIVGCTNASLTLPSVTTNNAGNYAVVVSNAYGMVTSSPPAVLTVYPAPFITNQPINQAVWAGGNVTLAVGVSISGPFTCQYQWLHDGTNLPNGTITTVAGNGTNGYSGDGGMAIHASLNAPYAVALDAQGELFIVDYGNSVIREVNTNGIIATVAGGGSGDAGYVGPATNASFNGPEGITVDAFGNLLIADTYSQCIRKMNTSGIIRTVAGNGNYGYSGDGGPATNACLNAPEDVAVDASGNLLIADNWNSLIRKVNTNGIITKVAGNGSWIASGDGGSATNAGVGLPIAVALDASGNLFILDEYNNAIRKINTNGIITTVRNGCSGDSDLKTDAFGNLFISVNILNVISELDTNGIATTVAGTGTGGYYGDGGAATNASLSSPKGVLIDADNNLFIADSGNNVVRKVFPAYGPTLTLPNVSVAKAGTYQVIVTGPAGCLTSSVVNLTVATSPLIWQAALNADRSLTLGFVSRPGSKSRVHCATNLSPPLVWHPIYNNSTGGTWQFTDTNTAGSKSKFYRLSTQ
jgi:hypothetical protein